MKNPLLKPPHIVLELTVVLIACIGLSLNSTTKQEENVAITLASMSQDGSKSNTKWMNAINNKDLDALLVCGIARPKYLENYLEDRLNFIHSMKFEDHHHYSKYEVARITKAFEDISKDKEAIVIMTEKDAVKIEEHRDFLIENKVPIFVLPVYVKFLGNDEAAFDQYIKDFLLAFKV